jgi:hypothetical protein
MPVLPLTQLSYFRSHNSNIYTFTPTEMEKHTMTEDRQLLDAWHHYAAKATGFIGASLQAQREKAFITQEQQRNFIGILQKQHDQAWLHLQAMPLPRAHQFTMDLERIVAKAMDDPERSTSVNLQHLEELIRAGLQ